jgi:hypothetical protein
MASKSGVILCSSLYAGMIRLYNASGGVVMMNNIGIDFLLTQKTPSPGSYLRFPVMHTLV